MSKSHSNEAIIFEVSLINIKNEKKKNDQENKQSENNTIINDVIRFQIDYGDSINYVDHKVSMNEVENLCIKIFNNINEYSLNLQHTNNQLNKNETPDNKFLIKEFGKKLCNILLNKDLQSQIVEFQKQSVKFLNLIIDDSLAYIPWEWICFNETFLCEMFYMGRKHIKNSKSKRKKSRDFPKKYNMLFASGLDHKERKNLPCVNSEIRNIIDSIDTNLSIDINHSVKNPVIKKDFNLYFFKNDIVHFAGHCSFDSKNVDNSGIRLLDGIFRPDDIKSLIKKKKTMPLLVFINACQSGIFVNYNEIKDSFVESFGLAHEMILAGCKHFIGNFWKINDEAGGNFALLFYKSLFQHITIGQAMNEARKKFSEEYPNDPTWLSYVLYGDPTDIYFPDLRVEDDELQAIQDEKTQNLNSQTTSSDRYSLYIFMIFFLLIAGLIFYYGVPIRINPSVSESDDPDIKKIEKTIKELEILSKLQDLRNKREQQINMFLNEISDIAEQKKIFDGWSSPPLTLSIIFNSLLNELNINREIQISSIIRNQILEKTSFKPLEKEKLSELLINLKIKLLSYKPDNRLIKILHSRFFLFLDIEAVNVTNDRIYMRIADEHRGLSYNWDLILSKLKPVKEQKIILCEELIENLKNIYINNFPMKAVISNVSNKSITLSIGDVEGVKPGQIFTTIKNNYELKVDIVEDRKSLILLNNKTILVEKGWKVISKYK